MRATRMAAMNKFNKLLQDVPESHRPHINAFTTDRDGTVRAFYTREPRPVYQQWGGDSVSVIVKQVAPMADDDWNHSLVQRRQCPALRRPLEWLLLISA